MRILVLLLAGLALAANLPTAPQASAGGRDGEGPAGFDDRPGIGHPVIFRDEHGGIFRPRHLTLETLDGPFGARLPDTAEARSEDRIDLSDVPILGGLFQDRQAPSDVEREGALIGPVWRQGDRLVLEASLEPARLTGLRVVLTADLPRDGTISMELGRLAYAPGPGAAQHGRARVGMAYLFEGMLVIASDGARPAITDWGIF